MKSEFRKNVITWGHEGSVDVVFEEYSKHPHTQAQEETYAKFSAEWEKYTEMARKALEEYCRKEFSEELEAYGAVNFSDPWDIFRPKTFYIPWDFEDGDKMVGLVFHFLFDEEFHAAVKFNNGAIVEVGGEFILS